MVAVVEHISPQTRPIGLLDGRPSRGFQGCRIIPTLSPSGGLEITEYKGQIAELTISQPVFDFVLVL